MHKLLIRKKAIELHNEQAGLFADWYDRSEKNPYFNAFTYGRKQFMEFLADWLGTHLSKGAEILDVGCGSGHTMRQLRMWGYRVVGAEPAEAMRQKAQRLNPGVQIVCATVDALPFEEEKFDAVFAIEVYRYLSEEDCRAGYAEAFRVLKPGGYVLFTLANTYSLNGFALFYALKRFLNFLRGKRMHYDHFTTPHAITRTLYKHFGEQIEQVETHGLAFAFLHILYKVHRGFAASMARLVEPFDRRMSKSRLYSPFGANLVVIARKKR